MATNEKSAKESLLPGPDTQRQDASWLRTRKLRRTAIFSAAFIGLLYSVNLALHIHKHGCNGKGSIGAFWTAVDGSVPHEQDLSRFSYGSQAVCPQEEQLLPERNKELWESIGTQIETDDFKAKAVEWLGGAVKVETESFDKMDPVGVDPRWTKFGAFHSYLEKAFPLVHTNLDLTKVNTYGLLFEWEGSDPSLKPLLLAAHQDVVPVDPRTVDEWVHPPYSGHFDGEYIWGRGSSDDKSGLIGTLSAVETLLGAGFQPTRKIVLSFGFDEEVSGVYGAQELGKFLDAKYGKDSFAMLVDEGGGFSEQYGGVFAVPAIGEKGYLDTRIEVSSPGGHSSIPPSHTSIGILSALLVAYESHPIFPIIDRTTPIYGTLQCLAAYAPSMDPALRKTVLGSLKSDRALHKLEKLVATDRVLRASVGTTQAIDLIQGGVKTNALPEQAWAVVNHRIATQSSVADVKQRDTKLLAKLAKDFNLTYTAFGESLTSGSSGTLTLTDAWGTALEPAPITPTDATPFKLLSGTIRSTYNAHRGFENEEQITVAPGIMTGNTDTRYYWNLTKHIFRYNHHNLFAGGAIPGGVHTINEHIATTDFLEMIRFFTTLILNADEYEL